MAIHDGFPVVRGKSFYANGRSQGDGRGSFYFFDAQEGTDPLATATTRGLFVDSTNRLSYWNGR